MKLVLAVSTLLAALLACQAAPAARSAETGPALETDPAAGQATAGPAEAVNLAQPAPGSVEQAAASTGGGEYLRGGFRIGGHARLMNSFEGVLDVDDAGVSKTINVHILRDADWRYYFDLDSSTLPAGERVKFVVHNTHFTSDECW